MANAFEKLLEEIKNEELKKAIQAAQGDDLKVLQEYGMRQDEFNRSLDEYRRLKDLKAGWDAYYAGSTRQEWERRFKEYPEIKAQKEKLDADLAEARAKVQALEATQPNEDGETKFDYDKLSDAVLTKIKASGFITEDRAKALAEEARKGAVDFTMNSGLSAYDTMLTYKAKAQRELGIDIPTEDIAKEAVKFHGNYDLAYNSLTAPIYEKKRNEEWESKLKAKEEEAFLRGKAAAQGPMHQSEDLSGFQGELGAIQASTMSPDGEIKIPDDYEPGPRGLLGQKAGKLYREMAAKGELR